MLDIPIPPVKDVEPEDPLELNGVALPGDTSEAMTECFIEEYVLQGFSDEMILRLFNRPFYAGTYAIWASKGEAYVRGVIERVRAQWGQVRFRTEVAREPEPVWEV
ncbi:MAG: hypothetical protein HYY93_10110 [Planctomycetes bacterium]|nr:hypothetical protein [Planctomycetota bacterium]